MKLKLPKVVLEEGATVKWLQVREERCITLGGGMNGGLKMEQNGELKFKGLMDIWTGSLRLLGTANATGVLAAGAAYQAFDKKPDIQSPMKILVVVFLLGVISFALSQIAMFLTRYSMELYFMRLREPSEWERAFWRSEMQHQERKHLVGATWAYYLMFFFGMVSLSCFTLGLVSVTIYANNL